MYIESMYLCHFSILSSYVIAALRLLEKQCIVNVSLLTTNLLFCGSGES